MDKSIEPVMAPMVLKMKGSLWHEGMVAHAKCVIEQLMVLK